MAEDDYKGPTMFLIGTIIVAIVVMATAANLLRKPPTADPFDAVDQGGAAPADAGAAGPG